RRRAHHRRRLPGRSQRRRPDRHVGPRQVPRDGRLLGVLRRRAYGAVPDAVRRRQPRGGVAPVGALLRGLGRAQHLLPRCRQRAAPRAAAHRRHERHLEGL
ncbi:hypothetical protein BN1708_018337, partial [Verticillium longisporum]